MEQRENIAQEQSIKQHETAGLSVVETVAYIPTRSKHVYWKMKRGLDILFSFIALVVLSPLLLVISIAILIDDPKGSPIFKQKRCGRHGKEFTFYKFRSMCVDAEKMLDSLLDQNEMTGPVFKIKQDPRLTRIGGFLRKTSLDELPQFVNVLKGDMTIIGPRPPLPREVEKYTEYERQRLWITPGLSCIWQITPNRNQTSFDEWMEMDLQYLEERSVALDMKIILHTIKTMFRGFGV